MQIRGEECVIAAAGHLKGRVISVVLPLSVGLAADSKGEDAEALGDLNLPPIAKKPWAFKGFPRVAWWPPPGTENVF